MINRSHLQSNKGACAGRRGSAKYVLVKSNPEAAKSLLVLAKEDVKNRWKTYEYLANMPSNGANGGK